MGAGLKQACADARATHKDKIMGDITLKDGVGGGGRIVPTVSVECRPGMEFNVLPAVAPETPDMTILAVIERASRDPSVDVDKLERLLQMQERWQAKEAEQAFNIALTAAQSEIGPIAADSQNVQTRSEYASYLALDRVIRPIYVRHGFSLSFNTEPAADTMVRVICHVAHIEGHARTYRIDMPADGKGAKGGDVMTRTHATGAATTYGRRYLLNLIFNLAVGDDDGNGAGVKTITDQQCEVIFSMIKQTKSDQDAFCEHFKIAAVADMSRKDYDRAVDMLRRKGGSVPSPEYLK